MSALAEMANELMTSSICGLNNTLLDAAELQSALSQEKKIILNGYPAVRCRLFPQDCLGQKFTIRGMNTPTS